MSGHCRPVWTIRFHVLALLVILTSLAGCRDETPTDLTPPTTLPPTSQLVVDATPRPQVAAAAIAGHLERSRNRVIVGLKVARAARGVSVDGRSSLAHSRERAEAAQAEVLRAVPSARLIRGVLYRYTQVSNDGTPPVERELVMPGIVLEVDPSATSIRSLQALPNVDFVEPNFADGKLLEHPGADAALGSGEVTSWGIAAVRLIRFPTPELGTTSAYPTRGSTTTLSSPAGLPTPTWATWSSPTCYTAIPETPARTGNSPAITRNIRTEPTCGAWRVPGKTTP